MSYYYQYKFISPDPLYARVKEEMKSYFDAGMLDDLMFPIWTKDCLRKLGKSSLPILQSLQFQDGFESKLPPDFISVREAWFTGVVHSPEWMLPGAYYRSITTVLNQPFDACNPAVNCDPCNPYIHEVVAKTTDQKTYPIPLRYLLKPGNISIHSRGMADRLIRETNIGIGVPPGIQAANVEFPLLPEQLGLGCLNYTSTSEDTFDIRDGKLITNFRHGVVYLIYYGVKSDNAGYEMIPENYRIEDYIRKFLKQELFHQLWNQISDESFQQVEKKYETAKAEADQAYIQADTEIKKETIYKKVYKIRKDEHRLDKYERMMHGGRGRRGYPNSSWGWGNRI